MDEPTALDLQTAGYVQIADRDLGLVETQDSEAMTRLETAIQNRRCVAWVGAGMSRPIYRSWNELLDNIAQQAGLARRPGETEPVFVQRCKKELEKYGDDRYREVLEEVFAPVLPAQQCTDNHHRLLRAGFTAYVTTNFDQCIERANDDELIRHFHAWPKDIAPTGIEAFERRHLYHIHGVDAAAGLYDASCGFPNVVLAAEDYDKAYRKDRRLTSFLEWLFAEASVLFCGYSLAEEAFAECIQQFVISQDAVAENLGDLGATLEEREHFALWRCGAVVARKLGGIYVRAGAVAEVRSAVLERFTRYARRFRLTPILYADGPDETHYYLNQVLVHLGQTFEYRRLRGN